MDVRMPDGTVVSGVPEGVTQSELLARYTKYSEAQAPRGLESIAPKRPAEVAAPAFDPTKPLLASDYVEAVNRRREESPERSVSDAALDAGITLLKGAIGLPESFVGVADIPTKGAIGKLLEDAGYRPREAKEILDTYLSEAQQSANRKVAETEGFLPTIGAMIQNPSTIATGIGESLPQMLGGAGVARGILKAAPKVGAVVAGGIGEGILGAGSAAEQTRGQTEDKLLTTKQALSALGSGVGTAAFGVAGGRLAQKFGLDDIDTMLAAGSSRGGAKSIADFAKRAGGSGISEGVFEEMPQSAQEKMWANYATDKPILEGVAEAAGMGAVTGFAMGVGGGGAGSLMGRKATQPEAPKAEEEKPAPDVRTTAVQPTEPTLEPVAEVPQDVNAPSQDRAAMLKELEDQLAELEPDYNKLQSPVAEIQQPEFVAEIQQPEVVAEKQQPAADLSLEAQKYDTPDLRLQQSDAFGTDTTTALYAEMESHGRAALKNRNLTDGYAKKKDALVDAADAATVAFGTNDYSVFAPYAQTFPKMAKQLSAHIAPKAKPAATPVAPAKLEPVPKYGTPEYNKLTPEEILRRMYAQQAAETAAPTTPAPASKAAAPMPSPVVPTKTITPKEQNLFEAGDKIEEPEGVAIIKENWIGGVSGLGDRDGMYDLYRVTGGKKYTDDVQKVVRQELGDKFKAYRLMSRAELEELEAGAMGSQFASFTLNPKVAQAFKNLPAHAKNKDSVVVEMDLTPEHVVMLGHPGEQELIVDYGQGYNPSEIKVLNQAKTSPKAKADKAPKAKPKTNLDKVAHLRKQSWEKNPLMAYVADKGLYHVKGDPKSLKNEFSPDKSPMIAGYGPIFKSSGLKIDALLPIAIQDGFVPQNATENDLYSLIQQAFSGKRIEALYQEQGQEDLATKYAERMTDEEPAYEERTGQSDAEWHGVSEADYIEMMTREVTDISDDQFAELADSAAEFTETPPSNTSVRAAMEALGFTEEEIQNEERRTAAKAPEAVAGEPSKGTEPSEAAPATSRQAPAKQPAAITEPPVPKGSVRLYHSGERGEGETGRWVSTNREYAANYRPDLPLFYLDVKADDPRVNNTDYPDQGAKQGFTFNFELSGNEATNLTEISRKAPEDFELKTQTPDELKAKQAEIDRLEKENARLEKEAVAKEKADAARDEFVLTGSDRPADVAAAQGQQDIFGAAEEKPRKTTETPRYPVGKGLVDAGYEALPLDDPRTYVDKGGKAHRTFEKDGVRISLTPQQTLFSARSSVSTGYGESSDITVEAILVDKEKRKQGLASQALQEITRLADANGATLYIEPVPLVNLKENNVGLDRDQLVSFYEKAGFTFQEGSDKVMERAPLAAEENELSFALGNIEQLAKDYNGEIVYGNDDRGLIRAHGAKTGEPIYVPYVKDQMYQNDIDQFPAKSFGLKDSEYRELVEAKAELERKVAEQHAKNPFLTIPEGISGSKGVPGNVIAVSKGWAKLLKLDGNIHIMTAEEALANKDKFTGPHRALGYMGFLSEPGIVKKVGENDYVMIVRKSTNTGKTLEVIAHEMGHIHQRQVYENADANTKAAIDKEYRAWFRQARGGTAKELIESLRAKRIGRATRGELNIPANKMANQQYWFSFSEWYADQVSRWATTSEKPVSIVEKFFAKLGAALKKFFTQAKAAKFLPNETFAQYLDTVTNSVDFTPQADMSANDQLPLFAKGSVDGAPPTNYQNYKGGDLPPAAWENIEDTKVDRLLQYALVDKQIDTKRVIERIKDAVGEISDKFNAYMKEELYHGRTAKATKDFLQKELLPLVKDMKAANVTIDEFDEYLHNRHAPEYNEHINKVNPNKESLRNRGSGISNDQAAAYMKNLSDDRKATFEKLAEQLDSIVKNTQDILVAGGIETKETIDAWRQQFPFYVPLKRDNLDYVNQGTGIGAGYGTKGGTSKRATGSLKSVIDIFENIALQREQAIMKSEKARVGRALYGLAIKYPNSKFWLPINPDAIKNKDKLIEELEDLNLTAADAASIAKEPASATFNKKTGLVEYQVNPLLRNSDNVFPIRINGKDRFIIFNGSDPRAARMVQSLKNLDAEQMGLALGTSGEVTRFMASVNTQYNPVFGAWNFVRDVQGAALNLSTTKLAGKELQVLKGVFPALKSIYFSLRAQRSGEEPDGELQELFDRFERVGGTTGYKDQFSRGKDKPGIVAQELKKLDRGNVRQAAAAVFNWLSDYNDAMENAVRLSAFKVAITPISEGGLGLSDDQGGSLAKNLTVNFNRKGASSPTLQSLYAFFNASVQGTRRLAETLQGPAGKKIIAGGFAIGVAQAIALAMAGYDDDEPPQFLKDKNLIIPVFGGDYLIIPMPMGFNIFPGIGRLTTEYILGQAGFITGAKSLGDKALDVTSLVLDSFNPLGSGSLLQLVAPTAFDPLAAITSNRDAFGRPISKQDRETSPTPGFQRSREGASWFSKNLAELLNYVSSPEGTKYTKGAISPTADQIDYLIGQYTGGVGRELMKTGEYAKATVKGETEDLPSYRVPIAGKLYGETTTPAAISTKFYLNVTELAKHENELKQRMKNKDDTREYRAEHPEVRFIARANNIENQITALNKQKKALQEKNAPDAQIKKIDDQKTALMKGLNDQIRKLQQ
jgi:GNAT superfamily N-acetyltransferase